MIEKELALEPVALDKMVLKNKQLMDGLVQSTLERIYKTYNSYKKKKYDAFCVAFSGGKDSIVLLDLVQRALPHNEFRVVFSDTTMEVVDTYKAIEKAKNRWSTLDFEVAKAPYDAKESWNLFGPPSRTQRWCCSVHKSVPSLLLARLITGKEDIRVLVYDGVRAEESDARSMYSITSDGAKHQTQSNCSPLIDWNTAELFLYVFERDLLLNDAYRHGAIRVGCALCPMASTWWEYIAGEVYDLIKYAAELEQMIKKVIASLREDEGKKRLQEELKTK